MEKLSTYLYKKFISSNDNLCQRLCKDETIMLSALQGGEIDASIPMLVRNIYNYSGSKLEIKLSKAYLFMFQRINKLEQFCERMKMRKLFEEWVAKGLFPVTIKGVEANKFIIEEEETKEGKKMMLNVAQITKELQSELVGKILEVDIQNANQAKKNEFTGQACWRKVEEYITELDNTETLMVFNFIHKYPYIDEKQLLSRTMLGLVDLRKCVNCLITRGIVNFYFQTSRTTLYKALPKDQIYAHYLDHISQAILNLHIYTSNHPQTIAQLYPTIHELDDILILFGY